MDAEARLVHDIYAAALEEHPWQDVVIQAAGLLQASSAFLFSPGLSKEQGGFKVSHAMPAQVTDRYLAEVEEVDVWYHELQRRHARLCSGITYRTRDLISDTDLKRSRMHADYLIPSDIGHCLGTIIGDGQSADTPITPLSVYRPYRSADFSKADEACLQRIQPHLSRALLVRNRLRAAETSWGELALERVATPVVVLTRERKVLLANPAAEKLFGTWTPMLVRNGQLRAAAAAQTVALTRALEACSSYRFDPGFSLSIRLAGPPGSGIVIRLAPPPNRSPSAARAAAAGMLVREGHAAIDPKSMLTALYELTPAETRLVAALAEGATPESYSALRDIGISTVRTQLQSAFEKTGTHRQSDLMRLVMSIAH